MAKTSIYLPDDLAEQVRAHGIPVSEVAQAALRQAVNDAEIKENVMTDIQAVADRLNAGRAAAGEASHAMAMQARALGAKWARTAAEACDLEYLATYDGAAGDFGMPMSLVTFLTSENQQAHRDVPGIRLSVPAGMPMSPADRYWPDLQAGAREVWEAVQPLLMEIDEHGFTLPAGSGGYSETVSPEYRLWLLREPSPEAPMEEHKRWSAEEPEEFL
jgi:hypothetical protein